MSVLASRLVLSRKATNEIAEQELCQKVTKNTV